MLLMVEKVVRGGICHAIYWYVESNYEFMKKCDKKIKNHHIWSTGM